MVGILALFGTPDCLLSAQRSLLDYCLSLNKSGRRLETYCYVYWTYVNYLPMLHVRNTRIC